MHQTQIIPMADLACHLGFDHRTLVTRPIGQRVLPELEARLRASSAPVILLDFDTVTLIDGSFADETLGALALARAERRAEWGCLGICRLNDDSRINLRMALLTRPIHTKGLRNCLLPVLDAQEGVDLVGKVEGHVQETFELLGRCHQLTARDVSKEFKLDIPAASTRLKVLFDLGLVTRTEERDPQGKAFVYVWPW